MSYIVVIPARYRSSRLPGKPLADIAGKPMLQWVYERALQCQAARVIIATDDRRVAEVALGFTTEVCLTDASHPSGTDRIEEVARQLQLGDSDIVVNVQGDEPLIPAAVIEQVAANLAANETASVATLSEPITDVDSLFNPDIVKVVADIDGMALYFSRAPIPWNRDAFASGQPGRDWPVSARRHLGIYAYRVGFLREFVSWAPHPLELAESLEQLRAMANGARIHVAAACAEVPPGVDTQADLEQVRSLLGRSTE